MDEGTLGLVLGLSVACVAFLAWRIETKANSLRIELIETAAKLENSSAQSIPDFDELKESLEDLIADTIGSMRPPQLVDHLGAMAQQFFQMKMATQMKDLDLASMLTGSDEVEDAP